MPQLLDVVALTVDLPEYNLLRGQVGTIVELLADDAAFEVEFSDSNGQTISLYSNFHDYTLLKPAISLTIFESVLRGMADFSIEFNAVVLKTTNLRD